MNVVLYIGCMKPAIREFAIGIVPYGFSIRRQTIAMEAPVLRNRSGKTILLFVSYSIAVIGNEIYELTFPVKIENS